MKKIEARVVDSHNLHLSKAIGLKKGANIEIQITPFRNAAVADKKNGLLSSLKKIKIKGPVDFASKIDAYTYGASNE